MTQRAEDCYRLVWVISIIVEHGSEFLPMTILTLFNYLSCVLKTSEYQVVKLRDTFHLLVMKLLEKSYGTDKCCCFRMADMFTSGLNGLSCLSENITYWLF